MITYLDLLPKDILDTIEKEVELLYLDEHKKIMHDLRIELKSFWLIALWGAGFGKNSVVKNLYSSSKENQQLIVREYDYFIDYLRDSGILSFPKPKTINYIMKNYKLHDSSHHENNRA